MGAFRDRGARARVGAEEPVPDARQPEEDRRDQHEPDEHVLVDDGSQIEDGDGLGGEQRDGHDRGRASQQFVASRAAGARTVEGPDPRVIVGS